MVFAIPYCRLREFATFAGFVFLALGNLNLKRLEVSVLTRDTLACPQKRKVGNLLVREAHCAADAFTVIRREKAMDYFRTSSLDDVRADARR